MQQQVCAHRVAILYAKGTAAPHSLFISSSRMQLNALHLIAAVCFQAALDVGGTGWNWNLTCDPALEQGGCKGATPHNSIPEPIIEGAQASAPNVELTGIHPPLVAGHLQPCTQWMSWHKSRRSRERRGTQRL